MLYEIGIQFLFFPYGYQIVPLLFVEKSVLFPLFCFAAPFVFCVHICQDLLGGFLICSNGLFVSLYINSTNILISIAFIVSIKQNFPRILFPKCLGFLKSFTFLCEFYDHLELLQNNLLRFELGYH